MPEELPRWDWALILGGILSGVFGVLLAMLPRAGILSLVWLVGACAMAFGVLVLIAAFRVRGRDNQRDERPRRVTRSYATIVTDPHAQPVRSRENGYRRYPDHLALYLRVMLVLSTMVVVIDAGTMCSRHVRSPGSPWEL